MESKEYILVDNFTDAEKISRAVEYRNKLNENHKELLGALRGMVTVIETTKKMLPKYEKEWREALDAIHNATKL